jgi:hypothetical protein
MAAELVAFLAAGGYIKTLLLQRFAVKKRREVFSRSASRCAHEIILRKHAEVSI